MVTDKPIVQEQLQSLDDTDCYASAWSEAIATANDGDTSAGDKASSFVSWGGRGKGGRGLARKTYQPHDVVVDDLSLQYLDGGSGDKSTGGSILEQARLKLVHGHVYALVGRNGCGKSTLLRRMHAHKIPGLSPHITTLYLPQHNDSEALQIAAATSAPSETSVMDRTPLEVVALYQETVYRSSADATEAKISLLEEKLESLQLSSDGDGAEEQQQQVENICEQISNLEDELDPGGHTSQMMQQQAKDALESWGIDATYHDSRFSDLTSGQRKKVLLSVALICRSDMLLLDEPAQDLDVPGLIQLRRLIEICQERSTTVLLVSHDVDLINDVATDIIYFADRQLYYYPGNYNNFQVLLRQHGMQALREQAALEKKREHMLQTLDNLKKQPVSKRGGGGRRKGKAIVSHKKKLERTGIQKDEKGHRWQAQKAGTGMQKGSINSMDATTRKGLSHNQLLKQAQKTVQQPPDKAIQFIFRDPSSYWGEPLLTAFDLGYSIPMKDAAVKDDEIVADDGPELSPEGFIQKKPGFLFDSVDLCVEEGSMVCILGSNASGKSTLLQLLAKQQHPTEGTLHHASGVSIGYWDADVLQRLTENHGPTTALGYLQEKYTQKNEQDLRTELMSFGLGPQQIIRPIHYLSGGEQTRLALVDMMLQDPPSLILDNPTCHLDVESVEALAYGLERWKGTVVMVSHDASFLRSLDIKCYVLVAEEGKLRRLEGGMDAYLKHFKMR